MIQPKHPTWWEDHNISRPTKRYVVIFNTFRDHLETRDITEYDTLKEALEEARLLNIYYQNTPKPNREQTEESNSWNKKYRWVYPVPESRWWGYLVLDMTDAKLLKVGGQGLYVAYLQTIKEKEFDLTWTDRFFRGPFEIPEDYLWDDPEEYQGWLQYRWGDGKNSLTYREPEKPLESRHGELRYVEKWSDALERYIIVTKRVMVIPWSSELPEKRQRDVTYLRPNGDPVIWPGEFGCSDDYSLQPWMIEEEMAEGMFKSFQENKVATNTIGDHLNLLDPGGLKLALELDKYRRENEVDSSNNISTDSI